MFGPTNSRLKEGLKKARQNKINKKKKASDIKNSLTKGIGSEKKKNLGEGFTGAYGGK